MPLISAANLGWDGARAAEPSAPLPPAASRLHCLSAGKASPAPYQSPGHSNPPINESYYTDIFLKACPSLQPGSPVPAIRGLVFRSAVSGSETMPLDRAGFALSEDLGCFFTSCALIPARVQPHLPMTPGCRARLSPAALPSSRFCRAGCGKQRGSGTDARGGELRSCEGNVPPADCSGKGQTAATSPETPWGQSRCDRWALPLPKPFSRFNPSARADPGSKTSASPAAAWKVGGTCLEQTRTCCK